MDLANPDVLLAENSFVVLQLQLQKYSLVGYGCGAVDEPLPVATFGGNLRRLMARSGVRVTDVAAELGIVKSAVSGWLHGKAKLPNTPTLLRLAKAVRCSVDELLAGLDPAYDAVLSELIRHGDTVTIDPSQRRADVPASDVESRRLESQRYEELLAATEEVAGRLLAIIGEHRPGQSAGEAEEVEASVRKRSRKIG